MDCFLCDAIHKDSIDNGNINIKRNDILTSLRTRTPSAEVPRQQFDTVPGRPNGLRCSPTLLNTLPLAFHGE